MDILTAAINKINFNSSNQIDDPFFILNLEDVKRKYEIWMKKIPRIVPFYAVKCNDDERVLKVLENLGTGFDCASKTEFSQILNLKVNPERIIYANTVKQVSHLKMAADNKIDKVTFDTAAELEKIKKYHPNAKVLLRISFDASNAIFKFGLKFGCNPVTEAPKLIKLCKELKTNLIGIAFHVGSGTTDYKIFEDAMDAVRKLFDYAETLSMKLNVVDIGGGFMGTNLEQFDNFANSINSAIDRNFPSEIVKIIAEPGRFFVDTAFTLVCQVILKKVLEDGQIFYYINESIYMSLHYFMDKEYLNFSIIRNSKIHNESKKNLSTIWGCTCAAPDKIWADVMIPELEINDWIVLYNIGAYSTTCSTNFNGFSNKNVYLLDGFDKLNN